MKLSQIEILQKLAKSGYQEYVNALGNKQMPSYEDLKMEAQQAWQRFSLYCYDVGFHDSPGEVERNERQKFPFFEADAGLIIIAALRYCLLTKVKKLV